ncbi:MAG TPA: hypothetical protein EYP48_01380 [Ignisphaera sp.]|nr:hypothetical protein [Ignisphaera sp.]
MQGRSGLVALYIPHPALYPRAARQPNSRTETCTNAFMYRATGRILASVACPHSAIAAHNCTVTVTLVLITVDWHVVTGLCLALLILGIAIGFMLRQRMFRVRASSDEGRLLK